MAEAMKSLHSEAIKDFSTVENRTWSTLFNRLTENRQTMAWPGFKKGLDALGIQADRIPTLPAVNKILEAATGWKGVAVTGLEDAYSFYPALARREFPIGNFIRDSDSLGYTPAPDIFHDLYGHVPFYMDRQYADFCWRYGRLVVRYLSEPEKIKMYERFFWFSVEFPLVSTPEGRRIFGAGILSSYDESNYSLSDVPDVVPFDIRRICLQDYRIDQIQPRLFLLESPAQLYDCLPELEETINALGLDSQRRIALRDTPNNPGQLPAPGFV